MAQPAAVREPTTAGVAGFNVLADVFEWAKIKGGLDCPGSRAGSLLRLVAEADWEECGIVDMASVSPDDSERLLGAWMFCGHYGDEMEDRYWNEELANQLLTEQPGPMVLGAARAMHHACRIACRIAWTREDTDAYDQYMVRQTASSISHAT